MARGIIAIGIDKDDELITARVTDGNQVIFLATHDGMAIRFNEQDLRAMGRPAYGNKGINLRKGDYLVGAAVTPSNEASATSSASSAPPSPARRTLVNSQRRSRPSTKPAYSATALSPRTRHRRRHPRRARHLRRSRRQARQARQAARR